MAATAHVHLRIWFSKGGVSKPARNHGMPTIRIDEFRGETIVLHFGGAPGEIATRTLGEALIGFAETALAVSAVVDPGHEVEIVVEETGPGSFRAVVRQIYKAVPGLLSEGIRAIFWAIVATAIYDQIIKPSDRPPQIVATTDEVTVKVGSSTLVVPWAVYDASENAKKNRNVEKGIRKTFRALEADKSVTNFGITSSISDPHPVIEIPRADFPSFPESVVLETVDQLNERFRRERAGACDQTLVETRNTEVVT
jgi:hypothetical protein